VVSRKYANGYQRSTRGWYTETNFHKKRLECKYYCVIEKYLMEFMNEQKINLVCCIVFQEGFYRMHLSDLGTFLNIEGIAVRVGHHCCQALHSVMGISHSARASLYSYNAKEYILFGRVFVRGVFIYLFYYQNIIHLLLYGCFFSL